MIDLYNLCSIKKNNPMKNHNIKLIDSIYTVTEAKEILCSILNDKINFLNLQILSVQERFGEESVRMKRRVAELKAEKEDLMILLISYKNGDYSVEIDCQINMKIKQIETVD